MSLLVCTEGFSQNDFTISEVKTDTTLASLSVLHVDENGKTCKGVIICNKKIAKDLIDIFRNLYKARYPIHSIRPASEYGNDDERPCPTITHHAIIHGVQGMADCQNMPVEWQ